MTAFEELDALLFGRLLKRLGFKSWQDGSAGVPPALTV
jgi:hypothetical protein